MQNSKRNTAVGLYTFAALFAVLPPDKVSLPSVRLGKACVCRVFIKLNSDEVRSRRFLRARPFFFPGAASLNIHSPKWAHVLLCAVGPGYKSS